MTRALLILAPIEPCGSGNGLAMRVASFAEGAAAAWDVRVAVVPVSGRLPSCPRPVDVPTVIVPAPDRREAARRSMALVADPGWRRLLADAEPMPGAARAAFPALAPAVVEASTVRPGTPVLAMRSYLAPLGLAVARQLGSPWSALDLDDDDESLAAAQGDEVAAEAFRRLVSTFAPHYTAVSLASSVDARRVDRRHDMRTHVVPNAVAMPPENPRPQQSDVVLFVANLDYGPNVEAAEVLVDQVHPVLEAKVGRPVRIVLVGSHRVDGPLRRLNTHPAVTLTGFVEELHRHYAQAGVVVTPLVHGSGTRIKVLEAFAHRVPVVTTAVGVAGLAVRHREHVLVAETPAELALAAADVLDSPALSLSLSTAAYTYVAEHHAAPVVAGDVRSFLDAADSSPELRR
jgi:glycosyltransferase involved in cell wall biosynthesis